ncbi:MAG: hypothetical protein QXN16_04035 [Candidatus Micrarchaeaceae archaeon]
MFISKLVEFMCDVHGFDIDRIERYAGNGWFENGSRESGNGLHSHFARKALPSAYSN